ncbi:hypothetical protein VPH35_134603 [Triticum aestivum]
MEACEIVRLPEELLTVALSRTSLRDACCAAAISPAFRAIADSDAVWACFLPPLADVPPLADGEPLPARGKKDLFLRLSGRSVLLLGGLMVLQMSTSSATHSKWRQYDLVPLTRCPNCPRPEPLKRWVSMTDENGNLGWEFVKCLSKTMVGRGGKILKKCTHFEWMDDCVERIQFEGYSDSSRAATWELNLGGVPQMENLGSSSDRGAGRVVPMARYACNVELHLEYHY